MCMLIFFYMKTGIFYYSIGNLRPFHRSKINEIQLLAIVKRSYIVKYSMNKILEPVSVMQENGYKFAVDGLPEKMYGTLVGVLADNPASCSIGGFKESCSARLPCRQCKILKADISQTVRACSSFEAVVYLSLFCNILRFMRPNVF